MTLNASIHKVDREQYAVRAYTEMRCPACDRLLFETKGELSVTIACTRCKATWRITNGDFQLISPPKKLAGKLLDNWQKFNK